VYRVPVPVYLYTGFGTYTFWSLDKHKFSFTLKRLKVLKNVRYLVKISKDCFRRLNFHRYRYRLSTSKNWLLLTHAHRDAQGHKLKLQRLRLHQRKCHGNYKGWVAQLEHISVRDSKISQLY
jgi:hypothetical protein